VNFDQWIDAVNAQVRTRLGSGVKTQELSWDSAWWVGASGNIVASLADDEKTVNIVCDGGEKLVLTHQENDPATVGNQIADRLAAH
jgi:hypothetical protein